MLTYRVSASAAAIRNATETNTANTTETANAADTGAAYRRSFAYFSGVNDAAFSVTETAGPWDGPAYWLNALARSLTRPIRQGSPLVSMDALGEGGTSGRNKTLLNTNTIHKKRASPWCGIHGRRVHVVIVEQVPPGCSCSKSSPGPSKKAGDPRRALIATRFYFLNRDWCSVRRKRVEFRIERRMWVIGVGSRWNPSGAGVFFLFCFDRGAGGENILYQSFGRLQLLPSLQLPEQVRLRTSRKWDGTVIRLVEASRHLYVQGLVMSWTRTNISGKENTIPANCLYSDRDFGYPVRLSATSGGGPPIHAIRRISSSAASARAASF